MTIAARASETVSAAEPVGDLIAYALAEIGVTTVFGVISILSSGPQLVEVDMTAIGEFAERFAGPPAGAAGRA